MREHTTQDTGWKMMERLNTNEPYALKELTTSITDCPYDIHLRIELSYKELANLGIAYMEDDGIVYQLSRVPTEKEMDMNSVMWDRIEHILKIMDNNETHFWRLGDWDAAAPFLFEDNDTAVYDDEAMQKERDAWT